MTRSPISYLGLGFLGLTVACGGNGTTAAPTNDAEAADAGVSPYAAECSEAGTPPSSLECTGLSALGRWCREGSMDLPSAGNPDRRDGPE